ncbi:MAG: TerC family protein, partial [Deltaproteobacteria bacterium]|nr:TerC family protein [Deltaproteobacteria bacterium]
MERERNSKLGYWFFAMAIFAGLVLSGPALAASGIDAGWLGKIDFTWDFCVGFLSIVLIDLVLAGDNAVVIALAVKSLHGKQRRSGIIFGAGAAVALRVVLTFFVAQLLQISFVKLLGGVLILWIAVKLFIEGAPEDKFQKEATTFWQCIRVIVIADLIMSTDNILAVAGACKGNFFLLLFGLALSIPFVVFTSSLLSLLMDKYPIIVWIGAAVLGRVGGEMIITDPWIVEKIAPSKGLQIACEVIGAVGVLAVAKVYMRWKISKQENSS